MPTPSANAALSNQQARQALQARARAVQASAGPVPSPCVSICQMDAASGWCAGCLRTLDEIAAWASLGDEARREVWARLSARADQLLPPPR